MSELWVNILVQIPYVAAFIYLVLSLEDRRQKSAELREKSTQQIIEALLGVIDEISSRSNPDKISSRQLKLIEEYLRDKEDQ